MHEHRLLFLQPAWSEVRGPVVLMPNIPDAARVWWFTVQRETVGIESRVASTEAEKSPPERA